MNSLLVKGKIQLFFLLQLILHLLEKLKLKLTANGKAVAYSMTLISVCSVAPAVRIKTAGGGKRRGQRELELLVGSLWTH